jgi:hypothetical protein
MFVLSCQAYSHYPDKTPDGKNLIYCPQHIECLKDDDIDSCNVSDDKYKVWSQPEAFSSVTKGVYSFLKANVDPFGDNTCNYQSLLPHVRKTIHVYPIESGLFKPSLWNLEFSDWYFYDNEAICESEEAIYCPWETSLQALRLSENGTTTNLNFSINNRDYGRSFTYDQILDACGATSLCYVDIVSMKNIQGSLRVDTTMPDTINIVNISMTPESSCTFKRKEPFNTIYCDSNQKISKVVK